MNSEYLKQLYEQLSNEVVEILNSERSPIEMMNAYYLLRLKAIEALSQVTTNDLKTLFEEFIISSLESFEFYKEQVDYQSYEEQIVPIFDNYKKEFSTLILEAILIANVIGVLQEYTMTNSNLNSRQNAQIAPEKLQTVIQGFFTVNNEKVVKKQLEQNYNDILFITQNMKKTHQDEVKMVYENYHKKIVVEGKSIHNLKNDFKKKLEQADVLIVDAGQHTWSESAYSKMLIQTKPMNTFREMTYRRLIENNNLYVRISSHSNPCKKCGKYENMVAFIGPDKKDNFLNAPHLSEFILGGYAHPGCKHTEKAFIVKYFEEREINEIINRSHMVNNEADKKDYNKNSPVYQFLTK